MKKMILLSFLMFFSIIAFALELLQPADYMNILEKSKRMYKIEELDTLITPKDYSVIRNYNHVYRKESKEGIEVLDIIISDKAADLINEGEYHFSMNELEEAITAYKKALDEDPKLYHIITYIGQCYEKQGDHKSAEKWYKKAIKSNYIDFMAHWFLADLYESRGKIKKAVDEITLAWIFNRNHLMIKESLFRIYQKDNRQINDWYFVPQMDISEAENKDIYVKSNRNWVGYTFAKTAYIYEEGFRDSLIQQSSAFPNSEEEYNCLISLYIGLKLINADLTDDFQLRVLTEAVESKQLMDYILFEIMSPEYPIINQLMDRAVINNMKDYILNIRHKKIDLDKE